MAGVYATRVMPEAPARLLMRRGASLLLSMGLVLLALLIRIDAKPPSREVTAPLLIDLLPLPERPPEPEPEPQPPRRSIEVPAARPVAAPEDRPAPPAGPPPKPVETTPTPLAPPVPPLSPTEPGIGSANPSTSAGPGEQGNGNGGGTASDGGDPGERVDLVLKPDWVRKPSEAELARFTPAAAIERSVSGRSVLACRVRLSTAVYDCRVLAEEPKGIGFGQAALAASRIFRVRPPRRNGERVEGAWVAVAIDWVSQTPPGATRTGG